LKPKDVFTAIQLFGYLLYRDLKYEKAFLCIGKGSNGKSVFLHLIEAFLGQDNVSHVSLQGIDTDRYSSADIYGKMANVYADLTAEKIMHSGHFKMLTSGDAVRAQRKFGKPFSFKSYAKLIFSINEVPESDDESLAFFRRWIIFHFERIFEGDEKDVNFD